MTEKKIVRISFKLFVFIAALIFATSYPIWKCASHLKNIRIHLEENLYLKHTTQPTYHSWDE